MIPALIIVFREGFEAFLSVAIIIAFLTKTGRDWLRPAVYWGIAVSLVASAGLGFLLMRMSSNQPLLEGILGLVAVILVTTFVIHLWRTAPKLKQNMERNLAQVTTRRSRLMSIAGVFFFTVLMITREGMEAALMLIQVRNGRFIAGAILGLAAAAAMAWAWGHYGHRLDLKRFFQVTGIFLLLFAAQILLYSIHEFSEAGILPNSEAIHVATEPWSPVGLYGRWLSVMMVAGCALWLGTVTWLDRARRVRMAQPVMSVRKGASR